MTGRAAVMFWWLNSSGWHGDLTDESQAPTNNTPSLSGNPSQNGRRWMFLGPITVAVMTGGQQGITATPANYWAVRRVVASRMSRNATPLRCGVSISQTDEPHHLQPPESVVRRKTARRRPEGNHPRKFSRPAGLNALWAGWLIRMRPTSRPGFGRGFWFRTR